MPRLAVDTAYAALSVTVVALMFTHGASRWSLDEFRRNCEADIAQTQRTGPLAYRDRLTVKHYSPALWCSVSWTLGALLSSKWRMLGLANALVAVVSLARKALVQFVFGRLALGEVHHSYDRIINFVLFKVVSVRATLDADWEDLAIWTAAYCSFGALYLVGGLARDHLEGLRLAPAQAGVRWGFVVLLQAVLAATVALGAACWVLLRPLTSILSIEVLTILFDVGQTLVKYAAYAWDSDSTEAWEARSDAVLLCEFATDICILVLTLAHYLHILAINGIALNVVSVLVFFNIRSIASKLLRKTRKLLAFRRAVASMRCQFPDASKEDIVRFNDRCSICREILVTAKKLPCDHLFHRSCLRSWLVRHLSCPTCRIALTSADVGQWAAGPAAPDSPEHGSDLIFAATNST
ncbi:hypothetical protein LPJ63_001034 [Coemansia sp. RSA 2711]|nr:hypothetical protein LPJ63_001034 [Coemansia sp. RSA 2711]KAJ2321585.1 hypothetical protein IWW52_000652 [Coemansia sp. RSA 2704]KAJ2325062.1 hypothetical protein IWW51_002973 [Coemansia sp. RSA 2702]KAJ2727721.1 hypothetical protein H4R23_003801 [Coemansia sp. Cherry 401B]